MQTIRFSYQSYYRDVQTEIIAGKNVMELYAELSAMEASDAFSRSLPAEVDPGNYEFLLTRSMHHEVLAPGMAISEADVRAGKINIVLRLRQNTNTGAAPAASSSSSSSSGPSITASAEAALQTALQSLPNTLDEAAVLFIGVGSYNFEPEDLARAERQQCPDALLRYCIESDRQLKIILIDKGFSGLDKGQIFQSGRGWVRMEIQTGIGTKSYSYSQRSSSFSQSQGISLTTYATNVDEYESLNAGTLAGIPIAAKWAPVVIEKKIVVICGNFFSHAAEEGLKTSQYFMMGDEFGKGELAAKLNLSMNSPAMTPRSPTPSPQHAAPGSSSSSSQMPALHLASSSSLAHGNG